MQFTAASENNEDQKISHAQADRFFARHDVFRTHIHTHNYVLSLIFGVMHGMMEVVRNYWIVRDIIDNDPTTYHMWASLQQLANTRLRETFEPIFRHLLEPYAREGAPSALHTWLPSLFALQRLAGRVAHRVFREAPPMSRDTFIFGVGGERVRLERPEPLTERIMDEANTWLHLATKLAETARDHHQETVDDLEQNLREIPTDPNLPDEKKSPSLYNSEKSYASALVRKKLYFMGPAQFLSSRKHGTRRTTAKSIYAPRFPDWYQRGLPVSHRVRPGVWFHTLGVDASLLYLESDSLVVEINAKMIPDDKCITFAEGEHLQTVPHSYLVGWECSYAVVKDAGTGSGSVREPKNSKKQETPIEDARLDEEENEFFEAATNEDASTDVYRQSQDLKGLGAEENDYVIEHDDTEQRTSGNVASSNPWLRLGLQREKSRVPDHSLNDLWSASTLTGTSSSRVTGVVETFMARSALAHSNFGDTFQLSCPVDLADLKKYGDEGTTTPGGGVSNTGFSLRLQFHLREHEFWHSRLPDLPLVWRNLDGGRSRRREEKFQSPRRGSAAGEALRNAKRSEQQDKRKERNDQASIDSNVLVAQHTAGSNVAKTSTFQQNARFKKKELQPARELPSRPAIEEDEHQEVNPLLFVCTHPFYLLDQGTEHLFEELFFQWMTYKLALAERVFVYDLDGSLEAVLGKHFSKHLEVRYAEERYYNYHDITERKTDRGWSNEDVEGENEQGRQHGNRRTLLHGEEPRIVYLPYFNHRLQKQLDPHSYNVALHAPALEHCLWQARAADAVFAVDAHGLDTYLSTASGTAADVRATLNLFERRRPLQHQDTAAVLWAISMPFGDRPDNQAELRKLDEKFKDYIVADDAVPKMTRHRETGTWTSSVLRAAFEEEADDDLKQETNDETSTSILQPTTSRSPCVRSGKSRLVVDRFVHRQDVNITYQYTDAAAEDKEHVKDLGQHRNLYRNWLHHAGSAVMRPKLITSVQGSHWPRVKIGHGAYVQMPVEKLRMHHYVDIFGPRCVGCTDHDAALQSRGGKVDIDDDFWREIRVRKKLQVKKLGQRTLAREQFVQRQEQ
ncbi:unnamed protein product [Amoebophrya sp. A25]|nr:unnamed protein product [Amoebophrya sp. A25]|eukprot:GSA25T00005593001.1